MSEHEIERYAEKQMDKIDRRLMDGQTRDQRQAGIIMFREQ